MLALLPHGTHLVQLMFRVLDAGAKIRFVTARSDCLWHMAVTIGDARGTDIHAYTADLEVSREAPITSPARQHAEDACQLARASSDGEG